MISDPLDSAEAANTTSSRARRAMIDSQLRTSGVNAPYIIKRMAQVAREDFVPAASKGVAYVDRAIPLENGRWLPAPLVQGKMLEEAAPDGDEHALIVDAGSGYLAELFRPLVAEITVLSPEEAVAKGAKGKGADLLVIDGAVEEIPASLSKRLADGARIVTGLITNGVTRIAVGRKTEGGVALIPVYDVGIPRLAEFDKPKGWSF
ncbi:protein-L-isoaspartate O-methyltransferase family protein [Aurantiacibacter poecillastricola]|uniref:protein-L-isoaspartate O-methyltransferase family protein n=1 Tax=Aurantiacibacter poecillastricola TaxID=3064385 RepID=UPI00273D0F59|nr:protein-L-isoaspartate O-methyltransferase [Aurantiacibacter sp. 219JJ12-13]MDP5260524.1 protein-L-isoaspartate O-methyltransferase [Aurantiacibacter sp. 219JJ12-13]